MKAPIFSGVCTALVTPFLDGKVNYPMAKILLKRQMDAGIQACVLCGTTGEAPTLSDKEKYELIFQCKEAAGNDCVIIAGSGSNSTAHAMELSQQAEKAGADALLVVSPYYNKASADGLFAHYLAIAQSVHIPIILYNVPSRTGVDIPVSVYRMLSKVPNIVGVKEADKDLTKVAKIRNACPPDFYVWTGNDDFTVPAMALGAQGVISVASNLCPERMLAMTSAAINGDYERSGAMQRAMQPLIDLLFCEPNPMPIKAALDCIGYDCGGCRLPLCGLTKEHQEMIQRYIIEEAV